MSDRIALLMVNDGRFPAGQHAHSAGLEVAVRRGVVRDVADLRRFAIGRAWTAGMTDAAVSAWVVHHAPHEETWCEIDAHVSARMLSAVQRETSRRLGGQLLRAATRLWPSRSLEGLGRFSATPHLSMTAGAVATTVGLSSFDAALSSIYGSVTTTTNAGLRLLGLDPVAVQGLVAQTASELERIARLATAAGAGPMAQLPRTAAPAVELAAEEHPALERRLFAS